MKKSMIVVLCLGFAQIFFCSNARIDDDFRRCQASAARSRLSFSRSLHFERCEEERKADLEKLSRWLRLQAESDVSYGTFVCEKDTVELGLFALSAAVVTALVLARK